jgi:hypothetical protein
VPLLGQQVRAGDIAVDAAADAAEVGRRTSANLSLESLRFRDGRIDLAALAEAEAPLAELVSVLDQTVRRLQEIDHALLLAPISAALEDASTEAADAGRDAERLHRGVQVAPALLGADGPRRYLVLLTSPVEARNRFGFPGSYAVLAFDDGQLDFEVAGQIAELALPDGFEGEGVIVPARARPYVGYGASSLWQSVTIPPHFPDVAALATQLAARTPVGPVDGVVLADPQAMAAMVGLVGDVPLPELDVVLTEETTVDFVTRRQYLEFPELGEQADRKDVLADVADVVGQRLESASLPPLGELMDLFSPLLAGDHLAVGVPPTTSAVAAALLADTGADGGIEIDGDLLHVGHLNATANKIDLFLERTLTYDVQIAGDGALTAELTVALTNTAPATGLPDYLIGSSYIDVPPGTNRTIVLVYSPHALESIEADGAPLPFVALADGEVFAYQVQLDLGPGQRQVLRARLAGDAGPRPHHLTVLPNGLVSPDDVTITTSDERTGLRTSETVTVTEPVVMGGSRG